MDKKYGSEIKLALGFLTIICIAQAIVIGLTLHFGLKGSHTGATLMDRTERMITRDFPEAIRGISEISGKTSQIRSAVADLKLDVGKVNTNLSNVASDMGTVRNDLTGLKSDLSSSVLQRSWLIWGNGLNPYVMLGLLGLIALFALLAIRRKSRGVESPDLVLTGQSAHQFDQITHRLDELTDAIKTYEQRENQTELISNVERLVEESRSLVIEARNEINKYGSVNGLDSKVEREQTNTQQN